MVGLGGKTCGEYANEYRQNTQLTDGYYISWAGGYMSGLNVNSKNNMRNLDPFEQVYRSIRSECAKNPLKNFDDVALEIYLTLPIIKQKP
jgi:hypothetical protein